MRRFVIRLGLAALSNSALLAKAQTIVSDMTANANYSTPNPTLIAIGTLISDFSAALTAFGSTGNRGSHLEAATLLTTRAALEDGLTALANYCMTTTPYDRDAFLSGGWEVKKESTPSFVLQAVQFLHQFLSRDVNYGQVKLRWKKPLDTPRDVINAYNIYRNTTAIFGTATHIATVTKTTYTDSGLTQPFYYYWVVPIGASGYGVTSDVCLATVALQPV